MKLILVLVIIGTLGLSAATSYSQEAKLSLNLENVTIKDVLKEIKKQSDFSFWYNNNELNDNKRITINVENITVDKILDLAFKGEAITYEIKDKFILIFKPVEEKLNLTENLAQQIKVTGVVKDAMTNEPLVGVNIIIQGTTIGVSTDINGNFSLAVPGPDVVLVASFIGYNTETFSMNGQANISISLVPDIQKLDEVIVVGYGTQKKRDISGSVGYISADDVQQVRVTSLDQTLQGRVAGVQLTQNSSAPGGSTTIRVRGATSFSSNEPLYVIDGIPVYNDNNLNTALTLGGGQKQNVLSTINPSDIESISVLKDAASTSIYGSRGANGVVIITTRKGKSGAPKISLESYYGVQQLAHKINVLDASDFVKLSNEAHMNEGLPVYKGNDPYYKDIPFTDLSKIVETYGKGTDWQNQITQVAPISNYQLAISGGNETSNYSVSGGYFTQDGIIINSGFKRYSLRYNVNSNLRKWLKVGSNASISKTASKVIPTDGNESSSSVILPALRFLPTISPINAATGYYNVSPPAYFGNMSNPLIPLKLNDNINNSFRTLGSAFAEIEPARGLIIKSSLSTDILYDDSQLFNVAYGNQGVKPELCEIWNATTKQVMWLSENTITYQKVFATRHDVKFIAGYSAQAFHTESTFINVKNFANDINRTISNASEIASRPGGGYSEYSLLSSFARLNYSFANKILATATVRRDGSSRFGKNNRYGTFPSLSLAYRLSEENFMQHIDFINEAKIRGSYGISGNQEIGNYNASPLMNTPGFSYVINGKPVLGTWASSIPNYDLGWESTAQSNAGIDIALLKNRIEITADYYDKITSNVLVYKLLEYHSGFANYMVQNLGKIQNKGLEFGISGHIISGKNFDWFADFNYSTNKNKVLSYPGGRRVEISSDNGKVGQTIIEEGEPLGIFYGFKTAGIFKDQGEVDAYKKDGNAIQPNAKPGDIRFADINDDGKIDENDRTKLGNAFPTYLTGLNNRFSYKNLELSFFLIAQFGNEIYNDTRRLLENMTGGANQSIAVKDRWLNASQPGNGTMPRATSLDANGNSRMYSDRWLEDGSFIRCRNITLSYSLPKNFLQKFNITSLKVYVTAQNAFTITKYKGYDPEVSSNGQGVLFPGYDIGSYPSNRSLIIGLNLNL